MPTDGFVCDRFPRASTYHPDWIRESTGGGANSLWLTEWLAGALGLQPGMRVLDLGCGRGASSIFLHKEFGVHVYVDPHQPWGYAVGVLFIVIAAVSFARLRRRSSE